MQKQKKSKTNNANFDNPYGDVKVDMVKANEMSEEERKAIFDREASIDAIPDLNVLTKNVYDILKYLDKTETKNLMKKNTSAVRMLLNDKYADSVPLGIIDMLMEEENKEENIDRLLRIFESLKQAKLGKISLDNGLDNLTNEVNERYLYSKHGSKEDFERALAMEIQAEQRKKKMDSKSVDLKNIGKVTIKN